MDYSIFDLGFDKFISRSGQFDPLTGADEMPTSSYMQSDYGSATNPSNLSSGELVGNQTLVDGYMQSDNYVAGVSGWKLTSTSADMNISFSVDSLDIPDTTTANSFHTDVNGNSWWGAVLLVNATAKILNTGAATFTMGTIAGWTIAATYLYYDGATDALSAGLASLDYPFYAGKKYTDRATAPYRVTPAGDLFASSATVSGAITAGVGSSLPTGYLSGTIAQANLNLADRGWTQTSVFSVTDEDTVAWGSGVLTSADGTAYNISAGNTGNMSAKTYIYLDIAVSITVYQITTTATTAVGVGKVLVAVAQNGTTESTFTVMQGQGGQNIDAASIVAGSITANEIAASTITAGKMSITTLSSIVANLGTITAGNITLDSSGYIRGGATAYLTGTGFFLGYDTSAHKFYLGTPTEYIAFNGATFDITVPINTPHYFTMYMPWKTSTSSITNVPYDLNKMWEIKGVSSQVVDKPTYLWVWIYGENTSSGNRVDYTRLMKYKRNNSGEYDYTGVNWQTENASFSGPSAIYSACQYGDSYVYIVWRLAANYYLTRLDVSDLGNSQTVTGLNSSYLYIASDGTKLYFYNDSTTVKVFSVTNATTVADDSTDITLASDPGTRHFITNGTYFYFTGTTNVKKYAVSNGALSATSDAYNVPDNAVASAAVSRILDANPGSTIKDNGAFWSQGICHRVLQQIVCNSLTTGPSASVYMNCAADTYTYLEAIPCPKI